MALLSFVGQAAAEPIYGITDPTFFPSALVRFDSATPGAATIVGPISGLVAGQTLRAIDFRPANGLLYAVSTNTTAGQLYTINLATGALSAVGSGFALAGNTSGAVSIDFNPVVDRLRVVTGSGQNYRVNPINGTLVAQDTNITPAGTTLIADVAYSNNVAGAASTTLYAYDFVSDQLDTIGSVGGTPTSPNGGQTFVIGDTGLLSGSEAIGLDISGVTGIAYASVFDDGAGVNGFYRVNLATGLFTLVGAEAFALLDFSVVAAAVTAVPEPGSLALLGAGLALLALMLRRRRH